jgi:opacity protein-like surface antigen
MNSPLSFRSFFQCLSVGLLGWNMVKGGVVEAQEIQQPSSFDRIENRMKQLSDKFKALGTRSSNPPVSVSPPESSASGIPDYKVDFTNPGTQPSRATVSASADDRPLGGGSVPPQKTSLESEFGSYYFQVFGGYVVPQDVSLQMQTAIGVVNEKIDTDSGYQIGILTGRRFGNWLGELHLAYGEVGYEGLINPSLTSVDVKGEGELVDVGVKLSYGVPIGTSGWIYTGLGVGCGFRDDSFSHSLYLPPAGSRPATVSPLSDDNADEIVFSYSAFLGLGYAFTDTVNARLGYRYLVAGKNDNFGALRHHVFEGALGGSF